MGPTQDDPTRPSLEDDAYLDTVALLQEEVARLEAELRLRADEPPPAPDEPRAVSSLEDQAAEARIAELSGLLADRDETIGLLWEQIVGLEEVQAAREAEWDQLHRWVQALEDRIDGGGDPPPGDPDEGHREAEALREQLVSERRAWDAGRRHLEQEIAQLRDRIETASGQGGATASEALEQENRRLAEQCRRLPELEAQAAEAASLRDQVRELREALDQARQQVAEAEDERDRQRTAHQAELASLRARQAGQRVSAGDLSPNERIRALREHYREIHEREERERRERQLSARLSRLWQRSRSSH